SISLVDGGIVQVGIRPDIQQTKEDAYENVRVACELVSRPWVLVDLRQAQLLEADVRVIYKDGCKDFSGVAFVVANHPLGRMMGNIYLRLARPGVPARIFASIPDALQWLRETSAS